MDIIDEYLYQIETALSNPSDKCQLHALVEEVYSVFVGVISDIGKGLNLKKSSVVIPGEAVKYDSLGDLKKLRDKLLAYKESQVDKLLSDPFKFAISKVDSDIARCEAVLGSEDESEAEKLVMLLVGAYELDIEGIAVGMSIYGYDSTGPLYDVCLLKEKLERYKARLTLACIKQNQTTVTVNNASSVCNTVNIDISIKQAIKQVQNLSSDVLSDKDKNELKLMLCDLDKLKGKDKKDSSGRFGEVLRLLADKSIDVAIAVVPYLAKFLQDLG